MPQTAVGARRQSIVGAERLIDEPTQLENPTLPTAAPTPKLKCTCPEKSDDPKTDHWGHCASLRTATTPVEAPPPAPKKLEPVARTRSDETARAPIPPKPTASAPKATEITKDDLVADEFVGPIEDGVPIPPPQIAVAAMRYGRVHKLQVGQSCWVRSKKPGNIIRHTKAKTGGSYTSRREDRTDPKTGVSHRGSRIWRLEPVTK